MNVKKIVIGGAAATALGIAALAGTGTAFASAPTTNTHQTSTVQRGSQSAPDTAASTEKAGVEAVGQPDGDNVQQGDQSSPDTAASAEKAGTESGVSDGPGGHADAGGSSVDHQFEGNE